MKPISFIAGLLLLCTGYPAFSDPSYIEFDPPGSTSTIVTGINASGTVTGFYFQNGAPLAGFIRQPDGKIRSFLVGKKWSTFAQAINNDGLVAGYYYDRHGIQTGFIRDASGKITTIPGPIRELQCATINGNGDVAGTYWTGQHNAGFLRMADGTFTSIDPPGAQSTFAVSMNDDDLVTGQFDNGGGTAHGYLFGPGGHFADITPPDWASNRRGALFPTAINGPGTITGQYETETSARGYLRAPDGVVTLFDAPGARSTLPIAIRDDGVIAGYFDDVSYVSHGFVRDVDGSMITFDPPGSSETTVSGIDGAGVVAGWFSDTTMSHGYIRIP